ncbi:hypothetical protein G6F46_007687 [Rhizopus delemar]|uniref:Uncharacterized protein n=2 Tax=Rhizopus TaxID=4842 RepID=A0A9P6YZZ5_9FUNG|nr:hypothetical protein G6F36_013038 [Rhizopus arrhizus]KAG1455675.1 hypothetical protein G6F55_006938 [Rhizopus delemar]KAG1496735.1 hypothetical protein G6F54_006259 [Rhizopus delemar]KAG1508081.1 hypothetical protein G6F53_008464 [Rhizopus delemar]KAG1526823.1 hypothetical protein G6F52_002085 [Rhizopus delemar]
MKHIAFCRKKINVEEEDQVKLQGLDVSLMSYLKTYYVNRLHMFDEANSKDQYFTTITMNNVIDLTDESVHSQLSLLNEDQRTELKRIFRIELGRSDTYCDIIKEKIEGCENNIKHVLKYLNSRIMNANMEEVGVIKLYRHILENHLFTPEIFNETAISQYSEMDFVLYF